MPKKVTDSATATDAALNLNKGVELNVSGEPTTPKEKTTTEKLFPAFMTDDGTIVNRPVREVDERGNPLPVSVTPPPTIQDQTPPAATPTIPTYLKAEELAGKMVKLKVDGIEQDVPAESLIKTTQLERSLNARMEALATEKRLLDNERAEIQRRLTAPPEPPKKQEPPTKRSSEVEALESQIAAMQANMVALQTSMLPAIQESGIKRVEQMAKERLGTDDFRSYFDRVKQMAMDELSRPENANPQARAYLDSDAYYFNTYQQLKLKDVLSAPKNATIVQNTPALVTQTGAPVVVNNQGRPVSIPNMESSGGVPSRSGDIGDWQAKAQQLFDVARRTGDTHDWVAYYRAAKVGSPT